jgi:hypothetical protein
MSLPEVPDLCIQLHTRPSTQLTGTASNLQVTHLFFHPRLTRPTPFSISANGNSNLLVLCLQSLFLPWNFSPTRDRSTPKPTCIQTAPQTQHPTPVHEPKYIRLTRVSAAEDSRADWHPKRPGLKENKWGTAYVLLILWLQWVRPQSSHPSPTACTRTAAQHQPWPWSPCGVSNRRSVSWSHTHQANHLIWRWGKETFLRHESTARNILWSPTTREGFSNGKHLSKIAGTELSRSPEKDDSYSAAPGCCIRWT